MSKKTRVNKKNNRFPDKNILSSNKSNHLNEFDYKAMKNANISNIITLLIKKVCTITIVFITVYYFYKSINCLAGKTTIADIVLNFLGDIKVNKWIAYLFGFGGAIYGISERKLRQRDIKRRSDYIATLESKINPDRQSSDLGKDGHTNKEDR